MLLLCSDEKYIPKINVYVEWRIAIRIPILHIAGTLLLTRHKGPRGLHTCIRYYKSLYLGNKSSVMEYQSH
jgi:hypothetical protein